MSNTDKEKQVVKEVLLKLVDELIVNYKKYQVNSGELISLAKVFHALTLFPEQVLEGYIYMSTSFTSQDGSLYSTSFEIFDPGFEVIKGGYITTPGTSGDSFTSFRYTTEAEYEDHDLIEQLEDWYNNFIGNIDENTPGIRIEDLAILKDEQSGSN